MITYTVCIAERAVESIESYRRFIALDRMAPLSAQRWVDKVFDEIGGLASFPKRCPLAPENPKTAYEVRMRVVGKYLILFHVDDARQTVWVLGFRHGHQRPRPGELPKHPPGVTPDS